MDLQQVRHDIDEIDDQVLALLQKRAQLALTTAKYKREQGLESAYVPEREKAILTRLCASLHGALGQDDVVAIFSLIIATCRNLQMQDFARNRNYTISVQGMPGSFSEKAANTYIEKARLKGVSLHYGGGSEGVMNELSCSRADLGLMAINNSWGGLVNETVEALTGCHYEVIDTVVIQVEHYLLTKDDTPIDAIYSHPQALSQCRDYLKAHYPGVSLHPFTDTAAAAKALSEDVLPKGSAVIASERSSELYELNKSSQSINDKKHNETLFFVLSL